MSTLSERKKKNWRETCTSTSHSGEGDAVNFFTSDSHERAVLDSCYDIIHVNDTIICICKLNNKISLFLDFNNLPRHY